MYGEILPAQYVYRKTCHIGKEGEKWPSRPETASAGISQIRKNPNT